MAALRRIALVIAIGACGESLPAADNGDGGGANGGDAGGDVANGGDGGDGALDGAGDGGNTSADLVTDAIIEPWRIVVAGNDLVVTSHGATGGGVHRVVKSGGAPVQIGQRSAYGVAVKGTDDVWFCNADTAPGLVEVSLDGGTNNLRFAEVCYDVAVETNGHIAFTQASQAQRWDVDAGIPILLFTGSAPDGIAADSVGVFIADRIANKIGVHTYGIGPGTLANTGAQPTRVRADGGFVYWVESGTNEVHRVRDDASGVVELVSTAPSNTVEGGLAVDETHVYWVVARGPSAGLYRAKKTGGSSEAMKTGLTFPVDVALDDAYAYVTVHDENKVLRLPKK